MYCSKEIQFFTTINGGGQKFLQESPNEVPMGLWPLVTMECANNEKIVSRRKDRLCDEPTRRADMLFYLLRGPVSLALKS
jgi:hypothetical protein